ncbi:hypothetical protein [Levilactobacillus spicheri]|uniref:hypothetical protein n=1 Tax=Levilactobacillus spicheri TaxID=216463 RepID=UPI0012E0AA93|nr:hypothetical protein [Levilactobacillus spicheri]
MIDVHINSSTSYARINSYPISFLDKLDKMTSQNEISQCNLVNDTDFKDLLKSIQYLSPNFYSFFEKPGQIKQKNEDLFIAVWSSWRD